MRTYSNCKLNEAVIGSIMIPFTLILQVVYKYVINYYFLWSIEPIINRQRPYMMRLNVDEMAKQLSYVNLLISVCI